MAEEDPALVDSGRWSAVSYEGVFLSDENRIPVTCTGFERDTEPGTPAPLFGQQWALDNTGQTAFAANGGAAGQDLNIRWAPADGPTGAGVQVAVVDTGLETCHPDLVANVEAVQLRIEVTHANPWDLGFELTSPAGTRNVINPVFNHALHGVDNPLAWTILSNAFYGEPPTGEWTLNVIDAAEGTIGTLNAWSLIFYLGEHSEDS